MCIRDRYARTSSSLTLSRPKLGLVSPVKILIIVVLPMPFGPKIPVTRPPRGMASPYKAKPLTPVSYTHLRAHETDSYLVCRLLLEKKKNNKNSHEIKR